MENDHFSFEKAKDNKGTSGTATKGKSNRYESNDEVDPNDIDLEAHETLDGEEIKKEEEQVKEVVEQKEASPVKEEESKQESEE